MKIDEAAIGRVREAFAYNYSRGVDVGASVAVWQGGVEAFCLAHGFRDAGRTLPWEDDTISLVWSATKGIASTCTLHALDAAGLDLQTRVTEFWPEFGQGGKDRITVGEVLSHQAGLAALADKSALLLDYQAVVSAIEKQAPLWTLGEGHGYGPRTYGFLADEFVRRLTGLSLGHYWRVHFADPLALDIWIGLPETLHPRAAQILAPRAGCETEDDFTAAMATPGSVTREAFTTPTSMISPSQMNAPAMRSASIPSFGGIASARSLAKFYGMLAGGGAFDGRSYVSERVLGWMQAPLVTGKDKTLQTPTAFSAGFMMDPVDDSGTKLRQLMGPSLRAFGHPGAGGSLAFADPESGLGFAYVMNQMETGVLPKSRAFSLVQALYGLV